MLKSNSPAGRLASLKALVLNTLGVLSACLLVISWLVGGLSQ